MSITQGKTHKPIPNLSIAIHGSDGGISRTSLVSSLRRCLCGLIVMKRILCPVLLIVCATGQISGSDELIVLILVCSSLIYCFKASQSSYWSGDTLHGNPKELEKNTGPHIQQVD